MNHHQANNSLYLFKTFFLGTNYHTTFVSLQIAAGSLTVIGLFGSASEVGTLTGTLLLL